ncbi:MAG: UDP-N-acetylmuramoyl-L-alanyl-D-glutamate--2,6-diaminopimelate ligase [Nitrospinota bacterium]
MSQVSAQRLSRLTGALPGAEVRGEGDPLVRGIAYDSRSLRPGELFVAVPGCVTDGHLFLREAAERGAAALVVEREAEGLGPGPPPRVRVPSSREALARLAGAFYGRPSGRLRLVGVTGTNGKTTTTFLLKSILRAAGREAGLIGTIEYHVGERRLPARRTTPEAPDLQGLLWEMAEAGASDCVLEVSSHSLELGRVQGCEFRLGVFTNLTQDHLDFHADVERYFAAKLRLFTELGAEEAVANLDDPYGRRVLAAARGRALSYGLSPEAPVRPEDVRVGAEGLSFRLLHPGGEVGLRSPLTGHHNVSNILAAAAAALALGVGEEEMARGVAALAAVPGRFEKVDRGQPFLVVVDYAHTEDALRRVLANARELTRGRLLTVMGCGGDRDRTKRPRMGRAAAELSDLVFITSDNPRSEDPGAIVREVEEGVRGTPGADHRVEVDRRRAIARAVGEAGEGDTVLLAGKGHETYQVLEDRTIPFDDREEARRALAARGFGSTEPSA